MSTESSTPVAADIDLELRKLVDGARRRGHLTLDITSGDLHRRVGGYPGRNHRMPVVCRVMRAAMREGDVIVSEPSSGQGASLTIRYQLEVSRQS